MKVILRRGQTQAVVELQGGLQGLKATIDGAERAFDLFELDQGSCSLLIDGRSYACDFDRRGSQVRVYIGDSVFEFEVLDEQKARRQKLAGAVAEDGPQVVTAPMPGKVVRVLAKVGQTVKAGDPLVVVEAMKMENELRAARGGVVKELAVQEGAAVEGGARLCVVE